MSRIALVITGLGVGGAERQVIDLAREFVERDNELLVITMIDPSDWALDLLDGSASTSSLHMARGKPNPLAISRYRSIVESWSPDIVHSHMIHANLLSRVALVGSRVPLVNTIHNTIEGGRLLEYSERASKSIPAWTTAVSQAAYDRHMQEQLISRTQSSVVYNGINVPLSTDITELGWDLASNEDFKWLAIGRLEPQKNYMAMLRALSIVLSHDPRARLTIAGEGPDEGIIANEVVRMDLADRVTLLGHVTEVPRLIDDHHAVVNSSEWEGLPISLLETAARARPIVATDVGGTREIVKHDETGFLTDVDSPSIAQAMLEMMTSSAAKLDLMGCSGRTYVSEHFDIADIADKWLSMYDTLIR